MRALPGPASWRHNPSMARGKRISVDISQPALASIADMAAAARQARLAADEGQAVAAARLGVHVQTIGRIERGEPGVAIGHVLGMLALYGITVELVTKAGGLGRCPPSGHEQTGPPGTQAGNTAPDSRRFTS